MRAALCCYFCEHFPDFPQGFPIAQAIAQQTKGRGNRDQEDGPLVAGLDPDGDFAAELQLGDGDEIAGSMMDDFASFFSQ
jgi:hypothetical protein